MRGKYTHALCAVRSICVYVRSVVSVRYSAKSAEERSRSARQRAAAQRACLLRRGARAMVYVAGERQKECAAQEAHARVMPR